jgi:hypothetical protein
LFARVFKGFAGFDLRAEGGEPGGDEADGAGGLGPGRRIVFQQVRQGDEGGENLLEGLQADGELAARRLTAPRRRMVSSATPRAVSMASRTLRRWAAAWAAKAAGESSALARRARSLARRLSFLVTSASARRAGW